MKDGRCTKCGASEIRMVSFLGGHRDFRPVKQFSRGIKLNEYICCSCGAVETYLADLKDIEVVKEKCSTVEPRE